MTPPAGGRASQSRPDNSPDEWCAGADAAAHTFVDALDDSIEIAGGDGHHLQRVRRLRAGEHVTAADGAGAWRRYEVIGVEPGQLTLDARGDVCREPELVPGVGLAVALTKAGALETVVARCTELGVASITPVRTRRSVVQWDAEQAGRAVARLAAVAREAGAQCRRARLPEIEPVAQLGDLAGRPDVVIADRAGGTVGELGAPIGTKWTVVVGPEGGLDPEELEGFADAARLTLGPHVLRAETAPIAAVALLLSGSHQMFRE